MRGANDYRPPGDPTHRRAGMKTKLRALRRTRKRVLAATPGRDVADLDSAIARLERGLGDASGWSGTGSADALRVRLPGSFEQGKRAR